MTREEKEQYFACYWNQKAGKIAGFDKTYTIDSIIYEGHGYPVIDCITHLELTSLEDITDEHAIELVKPLVAGDNLNYEVYKNSFGHTVVSWSSHPLDNFVITEESLRGYQCDIARSFGYTTPFRQYSIEDLIKKGVLKLRKNG